MKKNEEYEGEINLSDAAADAILRLLLKLRSLYPEDSEEDEDPEQADGDVVKASDN